MSAWDGFEEIVAIADTGSFVRAATLLQISTSQVSRVVARLEAKLETKLFVRTTRKLQLTDAGRLMVEQSRRIIQERDEAFAMINGGGEPQGELRITCSTTLGERFISPIVRAFAVRHPRLSVALDLSNRVVDLVAEGYDLGIRTGDISDARLSGKIVGTRAVETCAAPAYLDAHGRPLTLDDLKAHDCLTGSSGNWHFREEGSQVSFAPKGRWRCNSGAALVDATLGGMGICQLPAFYVRQYILEGRLECVLAERRPAEEAIWAAYPQRRALLPKVRDLVDMLEQQLSPALAGV